MEAGPTIYYLTYRVEGLRLSMRISVMTRTSIRPSSQGRPQQPEKPAGLDEHGAALEGNQGQSGEI
jgi:hypothetical protein